LFPGAGKITFLASAWFRAGRPEALARTDRDKEAA